MNVNKTYGAPNTETMIRLVSVENYGLAGDGTTDDTSRFKTAVEASGGVALWMPSATYRIQSQCTIASVSADVRIYADPGAILKFDKASGVNIQYGVKFEAVGYDLMIDGLTFDGNSECNTLLRIESLSDSANLSDVQLYGCTFKNSKGLTGGSEPAVGSIGAQIVGAFGHVDVAGCDFRTITRDATAGSPNNYGSHGLMVANSTSYTPRFISITRCFFKDVTTEATGASANNVDCDGIICYQDYNIATDNPNPGIVISDCYFENCRGRCVKVRGNAIVSNCHGYLASEPIDGARTDFHIQYGSGIIDKCTMTYDEYNSTTSPCNNSYTFGITSSSSKDAPMGNVTIRDCTVFNKVDSANGRLYTAAYIENVTTETDLPKHATIHGVKVIGGSTISLVDTGRYGLYSTDYLDIQSCYATQVLCSLVTRNNSHPTNLVNFNLQNVNAAVLAQTFTADAGTDLCTTASNVFFNTPAIVRVSTDGVLPAGLAAATDYFVVRASATTFKLATNLTNALAGTTIDITDAGTGTHTVTLRPRVTIRPDGTSPSGGTFVNTNNQNINA